MLLGIQLGRGGNLRKSERERKRRVEARKLFLRVDRDRNFHDRRFDPSFFFQYKLNAWFLVQRGGEEGGRKKETGRKNASERIKTRGRLKELVGSPVEHDHHRSDSVGADDGKKGLEM